MTRELGGGYTVDEGALHSGGSGLDSWLSLFVTRRMSFSFSKPPFFDLFKGILIMRLPNTQGSECWMK